MKKIIVSFILLILIITIHSKTFALDTNNNQILEEQKQNFGITDFIKETQKYTNDFFENINISEIFNSALTGKIDNGKIVKKIISIFGTEIRKSILTLISILVIIVIHSILKSISDNLDNGNIEKVIYYVQYILIVTIVMTNFAEIIALIKETSSNLVDFMNALIPILITLMTFTGSIVTGGLIQPIILFMINFIGNIIQSILIPIILVVATLSIVSKISDKVQISKLTKFFKSSIVWFLGTILTAFVAVVSLEGSLSSSIDGITAKTTKAAVSSLIPVVGKVLGDAVDSVLGCGVILKNALGIVGIVAIIGICVIPVIKIGVLSIVYNLSSAIIEPISDEKIVKLLEEMGGIFKLLFAILISLSAMLIIGVALVVKISNSGMMYR